MRSKRIFSCALCTGLLLLGVGHAAAQIDGTIVGWGSNYYGQCSGPTPNEDFQAVDLGAAFGVGLKIDGTIVVWGYENYHEFSVPLPNANYTALSAGDYHILGRRSDGTLAAWGSNTYGQSTLPSPNAGFVAVAAGFEHSLGLKGDGSIVAWGRNNYGQCTIPAPNADFVAVAAGDYHSVALKADGSIVAWGNNNHPSGGTGPCDVPVPNTGYVSVMAGGAFSMGLRGDGSVVAWGLNGFGQCNVPLPNLDFAVVSAGSSHCVGLKTDGTVVAWGINYDSWGEYTGQCVVPVPNTGFKAVAAGGFASLAVKGPVEVPVCLSGFSAERRGSTAVISWAVLQPRALSAFRVWRQEPDAGRLPVGTLLSGGQETYEFLDASPPPGTAEYWLQATAADGSQSWYGPACLAAAPVPAALVLSRNHPNPFNPRTTIDYRLPTSGHVRLTIHDARGIRVAVLVDADQPAGGQSVEWNGTGDRGASAPSGVYFARLETTAGIRTMKVTLAK